MRVKLCCIGFFLATIALSGGLLLVRAGRALSAEIETSTEPGVTPAATPILSQQAIQGGGSYATRCLGCHGAGLDGGQHAPALRGPAFRDRWDGKPARSLYSRIISTMPGDAPGTLPESEVLNITIYVFAVNGFSLGPSIADAAALNNIKIQMGKQGS